MRFATPLLALAVSAILAVPANAFAPHATDLEFPLAFEADPVVYRSTTLDALGESARSLGVGWKAETSRYTGLVHFAYGGDRVLAPGVTSEAEATSVAREFLLSQPELTAALPENARVRNVKHRRSLWVVHFRQFEDGIPVYGGDAFVAFSDAGRLNAFGSDFFPRAESSPLAAILGEGQAIEAATSALGAVPRSGRPVEAELWYVPAPAAETVELTLAYRVRFEADEPFGEWETYVDARNGTILSRSNRIATVDVVGNVEADVQDFGYCDPNALDGLENLTVNVTGGNSGQTDDDGDFDVTHGGTADVGVTAQLSGPFLNVDRGPGFGTDASISTTATPGTPLQITFDGSNSRQDERDAFFHANRAHDFIKAIDPSFTGMDYAMQCIIGSDSNICPGNAFWSPGAQNINFCVAGGGYGNTGEMGNVVYHEYGHGVSQLLYQSNGSSLPSGDMHEGNSDVLANMIDRQPVIGYGFYLDNCTYGIRRSDNAMKIQDNPGGHTGGQIIAGFHWDLWQSLLASEPQPIADETAFAIWHFARDLGTPQNQPSQVNWSFIADDDDANLQNGTPNFEHICYAADRHGFTCPETIVSITHDRLGHTTNGAAGFDVVATITSTAAAINPASVYLSFQTNGGGYTDVPMTATGNPNEYAAQIPAISGQNTTVEYYLSAADMNGNVRSNPNPGITAPYTFDVAFLVDDLESGAAGWTLGIPGDNATTGQWELADPIGSAAQPEDDATAGAGTMALITEQCCGGCTLGCADVDNGTTTLLSPVWDLSAAQTARVRFDAWYSNIQGAAPTQDDWVIDVSNDGGTSWTNFVNTKRSDESWTANEIDINALFGAPDQVQLRFIASDLGDGSIVEAAVDDVRILVGSGAVGVESLVAQAQIPFALEQNQPNPFRPATKIAFSIPEMSDVNLSVYNVSGQIVRKLTDGVRAPGRYEIPWDGRDTWGARVAAGVYFYRLAAGDRVVTKKLTVMH